MQCADRRYWRCFPIIAGFISDYEKQMVITGVKSGQHCPMCLVPSKEQEDLETKWAPRTHNSTQQQIDAQRQCANWVRKSDKDWVHDVTNFA